MSLLIASEVTTESTTLNPLVLSAAQRTAGPIVTLNTANSFVTILGNMSTSGIVADNKGDLRDLPINSQTTAYSLLASDVGKVVSSTQNITLPANVFASGDPVSIFNNTTVNRTITPAAGVTLYFAGTNLTGVRTMSQRAICTILCVSTNVFVISGIGVT